MMARIAIAGLVPTLVFASLAGGAEFVGGKRATVKGYVVTASCKLDKNIKQMVSAECVVACAKAGSPFLIRADDGRTYWPIFVAGMPESQKKELMPVAGQRVILHGMVYEDSRFRAVVIETIERASTPLVSQKNPPRGRPRRMNARTELR